jgi:hypothetical protein
MGTGRLLGSEAKIAIRRLIVAFGSAPAVQEGKAATNMLIAIEDDQPGDCAKSGSRPTAWLQFETNCLPCLRGVAVVAARCSQR